MIEIVIFDWAGTTVDYGSLAPVVAFKSAFESKKIFPTNDEIRQFMGMSKWDHIGEILKLPSIQEQWQKVYDTLPTEQDREAIYRMFEINLMAHLLKSTKLKPGLLDAIKFLKNADIHVATTTGYTPKMMDAVKLGAEQLGYVPELVLTSADVEDKGRPAPDMIEKILAEFDISDPKNAVKIGDTVVDIEEGKNAGVKTIGIVEGSSLMGLSEEDFVALSEDEKETARSYVRQEFEAVGTDVIINNLSELPEAINSLNQSKEL